MKKREIVAKVKKLNLPQDSFVVFGSCPLAVAGIREANDIDFMISKNLITTLKAKGWKQITKAHDDKPYTKGDFEALPEWPGTYKPTLQQLLSTATYIDGIPFASLYEVIKWKEASGRPKDLVDLKLIEKYLSSKKRKQGTITICSSANFYKQAVEIQKKLKKTGYKVIIPSTAEKMKKSGDYNVDHYKTWYKDNNDYYKKTAFMRKHFSEVELADAILVLNYKKHGLDNYIGGNVLMEMSLAFILKKPIFILNDIPKKSAFYEELVGLNPVVLNGNLEELKFSVY